MFEINLLLVCVFFAVPQGQGRIRPCRLPKDLYDCFRQIAMTDAYREKPAEDSSITCLHKYMWKDVGVSCIKSTNQDLEYVEELIKSLVTSRRKREANVLRLRKEYRAMSTEERRIYHEAVQKMKENGVYDKIANYHQASVGSNAHGGPNFLGWHRIYLLMYEKELIKASGERLTGLPYIDWRLESRLEDPDYSILWTAKFLGNADGDVTLGPFAYWRTQEGQTELTRNLGFNGELMSNEKVDGILASRENFEFGDALEKAHNVLHDYIGGQMGTLTTAAFDPVFYMHHAFIDYIWWRYQKTGNESRVFTYPMNNETNHGPDDNMFDLTRNGTKLKNKEGYDRKWTTDYYVYDESPAECSKQCEKFNRSGALLCSNTSCKSWTISNTGISQDNSHEHVFENSTTDVFDYVTGEDWNDWNNVNNVDTDESRLRRKRRETTMKLNQTDPKKTLKVNQTVSKTTQRMSQTFDQNPSCFGKPIQNLFTIDCVSDSNLWVYIPVKIIHATSLKRSKTKFVVMNRKIRQFHNMKSQTRQFRNINRQKRQFHNMKRQTRQFRKINKQIRHFRNMFSPFLMSFNLRNLTKPGNQKHYKKCKTDSSGVFRVTVTSYGVNYFGKYEDYAILDNRQPLSSAMTYIAVKRPTLSSSTKVYLASFDHCGRSCSPKCLVPRSVSPRYVTCTGVLEIDSRRPLGYGTSYDESVLLYYKLSRNSDLPKMKERNVPIVFYCKQADNWLPLHRISKNLFN